MHTKTLFLVTALAMTVAAQAAAVTSAEIYTTEAYQYGRFSARIQFAPGSGVVSSFFLWKDGSEVSGTFWNELDFEKLEDACFVETNTIYGNPVGLHSERHNINADLCGTYHVYTYEWTPEYLLWTVDGVEIRRETGDVVQAYAQNTASGMQLRFNVWPGDETFGGVFNPSILPVYQYIDWVEYSSYDNGNFELLWRDDFDAPTLAARWATASWESPKQNSTHAPGNVAVKDGYVILALTSDQATGTAGANPSATDTDRDPTGTTMPDPSSTAPSEAPPTSSEEQSSSDPGTDEPTTGETSDTATQPNPTDDSSAGTVTSADAVPTSSAATQPTTQPTAPATAPTGVTSTAAPTTDSTALTSHPGAVDSMDQASGDAGGGSNAAGCACKVGAPEPLGNQAWLLSALALSTVIAWRLRRGSLNRQR